MKHRRIGSVMTTDVVRARPAMPFKEVAALLADHRISGLPVVDEHERVLGVISETDLMARQTASDERGRGGRLRELLAGRRRRAEAAKARAMTAGQLMSRPAVTVHPQDTVVDAARAMAAHGVERLPVIDEEDRLVGIVTRRDLLSVFLRPDREIQAEVINEVLVQSLWLAPDTIDVTLHEGVVTLNGTLERRSDIPIAVKLTEQVDGVVSVVDRLRFRIDDRHLRPDEQALRGVADDWLRKL